MQIAPIPTYEDERLTAVHKLAILDTKPEPRFDALTKEAVEKLKLACKNIGLVPAVYNDGVKKIPVKYPYTIDSLVEDLLEDYENRKKLKKKISK